ncbi:sugar phosphate isomerase/epimerase [Rhizobium leguminosarum]|uniref:sugar phosphate isomerase/epimerase family protein n=1 Tax=Rhizobium leguminosarum TaxID=384 RepID=UPI001C94B3D2|nr:sugar phosphate isomerase/epimerase family protein [Rhizobium leguminosarum]MBY5571574.1 sugar phosphate isomerase/epimerase [Rhizobium leguminosarum]MBY5578879.1 sugar phosphate isomerase/epimerase [Rhizobium leguminosarum]
MDTCITVWHWPHQERWYDEGIRNSLTLIKEAGFTHINWNPDSGSSYWLADAEIEFTSRIVADAGLKVHSVHGSNGRNPITEIGHKNPGPFAMETRKDFLSPHEWQRRSGVELLRNRVDLAAAFQSPNIVLHIDINDNVFGSATAERAFFDPLYQSLDEIRPYCVEKGVQIAAETLLCANAQNFLNLYERLFARYGKEFIGVCFDCGHWELIEPGKLSVLERFADRLIATHIHDNFGAMDNHLLPFDGRLDWQTIASAIAATPYQTPLNFETPMDRYGIPESAYYRRAQSVAVRLEEMVAEARARSRP